MYGIDSAAVPVNVRHELYAVKLLGRSLLSVEVLDVEVLEMGCCANVFCWSGCWCTCWVEELSPLLMTPVREPATPHRAAQTPPLQVQWLALLG